MASALYYALSSLCVVGRELDDGNFAINLETLKRREHGIIHAVPVPKTLLHRLNDIHGQVRATRRKIAVRDRRLWKYHVLIGIFDVAAFGSISSGYSNTNYVSAITYAKWRLLAADYCACPYVSQRAGDGDGDRRQLTHRRRRHDPAVSLSSSYIAKKLLTGRCLAFAPPFGNTTVVA